MIKQYTKKVKKIERDRVVREYFDNMPLGDFLEILKTDLYRPKLYLVNYKNIEVKKMEDRNYILANFTDVVYFYLEKYKVMPTPHEYATFKIAIVYRRLEKDGIYVNNQVKRAIYNRRVNAYISFMAEVYCRKALRILLPSRYSVISSEDMDLKSGVDIVVRDNHKNKYMYIHVTSNTPFARERALQKANKKGRDFSGHIWLYYDKKSISEYNKDLWALSTDSTKEWNGYYFFKKEYLKTKVEYMIYKLNKDT